MRFLQNEPQESFCGSGRKCNFCEMNHKKVSNEVVAKAVFAKWTTRKLLWKWSQTRFSQNEPQERLTQMLKIALLLAGVAEKEPD